MLTSSVLILVVLPAMYLIVHRWAERRAAANAPAGLEAAGNQTNLAD
jgi:hypothetical protein